MSDFDIWFRELEGWLLRWSEWTLEVTDHPDILDAAATAFAEGEDADMFALEVLNEIEARYYE